MWRGGVWVICRRRPARCCCDAPCGVSRNSVDDSRAKHTIRTNEQDLGVRSRLFISRSHRCSFPFLLSSHSQHESLRGEAITKHGKAADGFFPSGFVLQYIPMLSQKTVFESDNVGRNPGRGPSHPSEPAMRDDVVAFCDDELVFVAQGIWRRTDKSMSAGVKIGHRTPRERRFAAE